MKIAVASQNRKQVTGHTGRCRKFWIYEITEDSVTGKHLLELPKEQSFHEISPHAAHPLAAVDVLICGGMGQGLVLRLGEMGIEGLITPETDPDRAVALYLGAGLPLLEPEAGGEHRQLRRDEQSGGRANGPLRDEKYRDDKYPE